MWKLDCTLTWYQNPIPQLQKLRSTSTESRSIWCTSCSSKIRKIKIRFLLSCASTMVQRGARIFIKISLCFAALGFWLNFVCAQISWWRVIVTQNNFTHSFVYLAVCGGDLVAVENERHFVTPMNCKEFVNKTSCEWNIRTKSIHEVVVLSLFVGDIEEESDLAVRTSSANIPDGSNLTTIMIQVSRCALYYECVNNLNRKVWIFFYFLENNVEFCSFSLPLLHCIERLLHAQFYSR